MAFTIKANKNDVQKIVKIKVGKRSFLINSQSGKKKVANNSIIGFIGK